MPYIGSRIDISWPGQISSEKQVFTSFFFMSEQAFRQFESLSLKDKAARLKIMVITLLLKLIPNFATIISLQLQSAYQYRQINLRYKDQKGEEHSTQIPLTDNPNSESNFIYSIWEQYQYISYKARHGRNLMIAQEHRRPENIKRLLKKIENYLKQ